MWHKTKIYGVLLFLAPMTVDVGSPENDAVTSIRLGGGVGSYAIVTRGCDGQILTKRMEQFQDVGMEVNHRFARNSGGSTVHVGVRGGHLADHRRFQANQYDPGEAGTRYINPYIAMDEREIGLGIGVLFAQRRLYSNEDPKAKRYATGHLRIGSTSTKYFSMSVLENVPLYSGGGFLDAGFGFRASPWADVWVGGSFGGTYDSPGMLFKLNLRPHRRWSIGTNIRYGALDGENGVGFVLGHDIVY
jgi:hypothetical protein